MENSPTVYHERQKKMLCGLHVLNNLFQEGLFTQSDLDDICNRLTPSRVFNPHKSVLGLGNYDINVITSALQSKTLCLIWFDRRKDVKCINTDQIKGFILNVPTDFKLGFVKVPFMDFKHWYVVRKVGELYYNLDSKLPKPDELGTNEEMLNFVSEKLTASESHLLLVVEPDIEKDGSWYREDPKS
ncbi:Josephin-1 [Mactra antiquata]